MKEKSRIKDFFRKYQMDFAEGDFKKQCGIFLEEMERGLAGPGSSLAMLPTYLGGEEEIPLEEPIIALDAGGTNLRAATVYFNREGQPVIQDFQTYPMPGTYGKMTKEGFFQAIAVCVEPLIEKSSRIGFCFSYPTEILPDKDGRLIRFTKEIQAKDVEGELIGSNLLQALKDRGCREEKKIVLLNDTVATLLAGKTASGNRFYDGYLGFILGTGTNACYLEENNKIKKLSGLEPEKRMIINVEWGSYAQAPRGQLDLEFDRQLTNPGFYVFEKMIAGAYIGNLVLTVLKKAGEEGLFSPGFTEKIKKVTCMDTREVDNFLRDAVGPENPLAACVHRGRPADKAAAYLLIDQMLDRAGFLTAIGLSALIMKTGRGLDPGRPVCITTEGTTFFALKGLRNKIEYYLKKHLCDDLGYNYEFVRMEHASLVGAAIAGLERAKI